jgi:hypothetical protein
VNEEKPTEKTLEMRVAAIEDILAKRHVTEEEMKTYQKVSNALYGTSPLCHYPIPTPPDYGSRPLCGGYIGPCLFCHPLCYECFRGPCLCHGGGGFGGSGFGGFGS